MKSILKVSLTSLMIIVTMACQKKNDSSSDITLITPQIRPPVQASLSSALVSGGTTASLPLTAPKGSISSSSIDYTTTCSSDPAAGDPCSSLTSSTRLLCIVKQRLFCPGPTEVLNMLNGVDGDLSGISQRSTGKVSCMDNALVDSTSDLALPGGTTFTHSLQCKDSSINMAWGNDTASNTWYVRRAQGAGASVFSITNETQVEGYLWLPSSDKSFSMTTELLHLKADKTTQTVEITGGGVGMGFCSFHFISNPSYIYIVGNPNGAGFTCDYDGSSSDNSTDWDEVCIDATTLAQSASLSDCDSLRASISLSTLGRAQTVDASSNTILATVAPAPTGLTLVTFDLGDLLNNLFTNAGTFLSGISEFTVESK